MADLVGVKITDERDEPSSQGRGTHSVSSGRVSARRRVAKELETALGMSKDKLSLVKEERESLEKSKEEVAKKLQQMLQN